MTHDPLCQYDETRDSPCDWCDLIARVREDERHWVDKSIRDEAYEKGKRMGRYTALRDAVEAVKALPNRTSRTHHSGTPTWQNPDAISRSDAVAAIEALGGES